MLLGRRGYPFCLELEIQYPVGAATGLQVSTTVRNVGSRPAPYGTGSHPYLTVGAPLINECLLALPASLWLPVDQRGIPVGVLEHIAGTPLDFRDPKPVGTTRLDHALTGLSRDERGTDAVCHDRPAQPVSNGQHRERQISEHNRDRNHQHRVAGVCQNGAAVMHGRSTEVI